MDLLSFIIALLVGSSGTTSADSPPPNDDVRSSIIDIG